MISPDSTTTEAPHGKPLTGRKVFLMIAAFFGVVFLANGVMLRLATSTFGGVETDSAYREGQRFNRETELAAAQAARGWAVEARIERHDGAAKVVVEARDKAGAAIGGLDGTVRLARPADRRQDREGALVARGPGRYEAALDALPDGQWDIVIRFAEGREHVFLSRNRIVVR
jgi:nitrogen fixation protein FixH